MSRHLADAFVVVAAEAPDPPAAFARPVARNATRWPQGRRCCGVLVPTVKLALFRISSDKLQNDPGTPYNPGLVHKRYRYGNQPNMGLWNLYQLANALYPIIEDVAPLETILKQYTTDFEHQSLTMMKSKLGLFISDAGDLQLIQRLEDNLQLVETDMTIFFRNLSDFTDAESSLKLIEKAFYDFENISNTVKDTWRLWFEKYANRLQKELISSKERKQRMDAVNPKYVLRNYMSQMAIDEADKGNYALIDELFQLLKKPYDTQPENDKWFSKRPEWARNKVGCSMLSCSS